MATLEKVLLESNSWIDHPFQLLKWPRPERSGVISILVVYVLLCVYSEAFIVHEYAENISEISPRCWLFPFLPSCEKYPEPEVVKLEKDYKITRLYAIPGVKPKKHVCSCNYEYRWHDLDGSIKQVKNPDLYTCDSYLEPRNWEQNSLILEDKNGQQLLTLLEYRWHCE